MRLRFSRPQSRANPCVSGDSVDARSTKKFPPWFAHGHPGSALTSETSRGTKRGVHHRPFLAQLVDIDLKYKFPSYMG